MEIGKNISDFFEMPYDAALNVPKVVIFGEYRVGVENFSGLVEYKKESVKLKHPKGIIEIRGAELEIKAMGEGDIVINGKISGVNLI